ncbi:hypothetical protein AM571_PA00192 (plasmid) [Rhizobium etli 8C-3]|uniref:Uncharacterized protein n=1 Tax=Rhizobium etli 8C-3 TaxID=538025 RepID=A0A1L5PA85_RHIET|nr:hypothetical protein AM571_PA00192 [Rhizobium etli 8C-3]
MVIDQSLVYRGIRTFQDCDLFFENVPNDLTERDGEQGITSTVICVELTRST